VIFNDRGGASRRRGRAIGRVGVDRGLAMSLNN
jgi:hypothetical protein